MILPIPDECRIKIPEAFRETNGRIRPAWGPIGETVFMRTYSMLQDDGRRERWVDTTARVSEGHFALLKRRALEADAWWSDEKAQRMMLESATRQFQFKWTPAGRGLQFMGSRTMEVKGGAVGMSCAFTSTKNIGTDFAEPFCRMFDLLMLGVGVGFDDKGKGKIVLHWNGDSDEEHVIPDTREGWIEALRVLLLSFDPKSGRRLPRFDFSKIRPKGAPLKMMGGLASGPEPLIRMLTQITRALSYNNNRAITAATICDVMNMIGACVVSGGVRRSSQIFLGQATEEFLGLKDQSALQALRAGPMTEEVLGKIAQHPMTTHRWASNNSVFAHFGMNYSEVAERIAHNGEPGLIWLDDMVRPYGRMTDAADWKDNEAEGVNPCQPANATVLTPDGIKTFADIDVGSVIWSGSQWTKVTRKLNTGIKPVFRYRTTAGFFLGTENHRVVERGFKIQVQDAEAIDTSQGPEPSLSELDPFDVVSGLMLGDGTYHEASGSNFLIQGEDDGCYDDCEITALLGPKRGALPFNRKTESAIRDPLPKTYDRKIPGFYLFGSFKRVRGFLRGLYSANGSIVSNRITLKASSRDVIDGVQFMLSSLGIRSYVTTNAAHEVEFSNGTYVCRESYDLNIGTATSRDLFRKLIGFLHPSKNIKLSALCDAPKSVFSRSVPPKGTFDISSVEPMGEMEVFDITVEADEHTYWTGGLLVSNCSEQSLHNDETCNLVELYMTNHDSLEDWKQTIKSAFLYGKAMTLADIHDPKVDEVCKRNRRIGLSITGVGAMYDRLGHRELSRWLDAGYKEVLRLDNLYSGWLDIPLSIKHTSLKPSGSVSTLPGVQGGIRFPEDLFYFRLVRFAETDPIWERYAAAGYRVEDDVAVQQTKVVYFPVEEQGFKRTIKDVSLREQIALGALVQDKWSDNMVSATYMVKPHERGQIKHLIEENEGRFKSMSFLPVQEKGSYPQMPYTTCTRAEFDAARARCLPVTYHREEGQSETQRFCDGDVCTLTPSS